MPRDPQPSQAVRHSSSLMILPPSTAPLLPRGQTAGCCFPWDTSSYSGMLSTLCCRGSSAPASGAPLPPPAPPALSPPPPVPHLFPISACPSSCQSPCSSFGNSSRSTSCSTWSQQGCISHFSFLSPHCRTASALLFLLPSGFTPQGTSSWRAVLSIARWQCHRSQTKSTASALWQSWFPFGVHRQRPGTAPGHPCPVHIYRNTCLVTDLSTSCSKGSSQAVPERSEQMTAAKTKAAKPITAHSENAWLTKCHKMEAPPSGMWTERKWRL